MLITSIHQLNDLVNTHKVICSLQPDGAMVVVFGKNIEIHTLGKALFKRLREQQVLYPSNFLMIDNSKLNEVASNS
jgi:hypothetical protein